MGASISVIVPVYNVESYLRPCLDSVIGQTFIDFEAILIDDGSKDSSGSICEEYKQKDSRFRVFHQANQGVSAARNYGLDQAVGEYVYFLDSDDSLESEALGHLYDSIKSGDYDLAFSGYSLVGHKASRKVFINTDRASEVISPEKALNNLVAGDIPIWFVCWNKLIPRELALEVRFEDLCQEDFLFSGRLYLLINKAIYLNEALYRYNDDALGLSKDPTYIGIQHTLPVLWRLLQSVPEERLDLRALVLSKLFRRTISSTYLLRNMRLSSNKELQAHQSLCLEIQKSIKRELYTNPYVSFKDRILFKINQLFPWVIGLYFNRIYR